MTNLKDVSAQAGVNASTISRYLAGTLNVRPETEERILNAIRTVGYKPNLIARALKMRATYTIGVTTPSGSNPLFAEMIDGMYQELSKCEYTHIQIPTGNEIDRELKAIQILQSKQVDGIIVLSSAASGGIYNDWYEKGRIQRMPLVFVNCMYEQDDCVCVLSDFYSGSYEATMHLVNSGRQRIAMISGRDGQEESEKKCKGYMDALHACGAGILEPVIRQGFYSFEEAYRVADFFLETQKPDAIIAANDLMAIAAMSCALNKGLSVPRDLAVIGYGNSEASRFTFPALSTIDQQKKYSGQRAASLLLDMIREHPAASEYIKTSLILRSTC